MKASHRWLIAFLVAAMLVCASELRAQTPNSTPAAIEFKLERGDGAANRISGRAHSYTVKVTAGGYLRITARQTDLNLVLTVFDSEGARIAGFDDEPRLGQDEIAEFVAASDGTYRIEVAPESIAGVGAYTIRIDADRAATETDRKTLSARQLLHAASKLSDANNFDQAIATLREAVALLNSAPESSATLKLQANQRIGFLTYEKGDFRLAVTELGSVLEECREKLGDEHPLTLKARFSLTLALRRAGETARAERGFRELVPLFERVFGAESYELATTLNSLANVLEQLNDFETAEKMFKRSLSIVEKNYVADFPLRASVLNNLGVLYLHSDRNDLAADHFEKSIVIRERISGTTDPEYSNTLQNLGIVYRNRREYAKALAAYERALALREKALGPEHPNVAFLLNNISNIQKVSGDFETALATQRRVRTIAEKSVGDFHELTLTSIGNTSNVYGAMGNLAKAFEFQKLWDGRFERTLTLNLSIGSERQKLAFASRIEERTSRTITLAKTVGQPAVDLAAEVVIQRKGRVLDSLAGNLDAIRKRAGARDKELIAKLADVVGRLAKLVLSKPPAMTRAAYDAQIAALETEKDTLEREINNEAAPLFVAPPVSLEKVRAALPDDGVLIEYAIYRPYDYKAENNDLAYAKPRYVAFVVSKSAPVRFFDLGEREPIDRAVNEFRAALRNPESKDIVAKSQNVRKLLIAPLSASFRGTRKLVIAPEGDLNLFPFEALADQRGRYLIDDFAVIYVASGRDLLRRSGVSKNLGGPFVVADPKFGGGVDAASSTPDRIVSGESFVQLPGTAAEADAIRGLLPDAVVITGSDASEERLKAVARPSLLHVASHGFFFRSKGTVNENPLIRSGLALAGANIMSDNSNSDGILTALEASALDLRGTKLVVLSACDTGLGEVRAGEGVYGLRRAFSLSGAESIVMTLWPVGDYTSRRIVTGYYKNLVSGLGRNEALRRTVLEIKKKRESSHPFYWAPFIHWGNWQPLNETPTAD